MRYKRILIVAISGIVAILAHLPEIISFIDVGEKSTLFADVQFKDIASEVLFLFVSLLLLFGVNSFLFRFRTPQRSVNIYIVIVSFLVTWGLNSILGNLFVLCHEQFAIPAIDDTLHHYLHPMWDFIITCVVTGSCYIIHLVAHQQSIIVENEELRTENLRTQYEALKNQLNPHMFFNSLNTLNSLIRESPTKAQHYTCELSKVLRYTLQTSEEQGVSLADEIEFVRGYNYLLKTRYEENLNFELNVPDNLLKYRIPPMAIQMLVENAVKHNEISNKKPLTISITADDRGIAVSNKIQKKISNTHGYGIGLKNLNKRYELLFRTHIEICADEDTYTVILPLIKREDENINC